jgi:hypothetical protein
MFFWNVIRRRAAQTVIDLEALTTEVVTPERLIDIYKRERDNIESVRVLPGALGSNDFGKFVVQRKRPIHVSSLDEAFASR